MPEKKDNRRKGNTELSETAKEARRKYHTEWQRKHPEKVREYSRRYWERKAAVQ